MSRTAVIIVVLSLASGLLSGCRFFGGAEPTRTPIPTFTPTPILVVVPAGSEASSNEPQVAQVPATPQTLPQQQAPQVPPTDTPLPTDTPTPEPSPTPTNTVTPTSTTLPTATVTPTSTPTPPPSYDFELEDAEKFPTQGLAEDVVRIWLYVYAPGSFGLGDYGMRITNNGVRLESKSLSKAGLPQVTRKEPGPYTRFTNLNVVIVEAQAGDWEIQLVDENDRPVGPPATFTLTADEETRELYVRYRLDTN